MIVIVDNAGFPGASFTKKEDGVTFYEKISKDITGDNWKLQELDLNYPYYWIWSWDLSDSQNKGKWKIEPCDALGVIKFARNIKRDKKLEADPDFDQYFYLGIINGDGISYGMRAALGMSIENYNDYSMFDHEHIDGETLQDIQWWWTRNL